jgi:hypothetical protein
MANGPGSLAILATLLVRDFDPVFESLVNDESTLLNLITSRRTASNDTLRWHIDANDRNKVFSFTKAQMLADPRSLLVLTGIPAAATPFAPNAHTVIEANRPVAYVAQSLMLDGDTLTHLKGKPGAFATALAREQKMNLIDAKTELNNYLADFTQFTTSGNTGADPDGLGIMFAAAGTTYAGVNYSTYPEHKPYTNVGAAGDANGTGGTARPISLALLQDVMGALEGFTTSINRKSKVDKLIGSTKQYYAYGNLLTAYRRFTNASTLDGGWKALDYEGRPFIKVPGFDTTRVLFLPNKTMRGSDAIQYVVTRNLDVKDFSQQVADGVWMNTYHYCQFVNKARMHQGGLYNLS